MKIKKFFFSFVILVVTLGCERDEICIDPITPHLILRFYDSADPDLLKSANVEVEILGNSSENLTFTSDSIALPLDVNLEETTFVISSVTGTESNADTLKISYTLEDRFIGRACGYKSVFLNPSYTLVADSEPWILGFELNSDNIENENNAHLNVFH